MLNNLMAHLAVRFEDLKAREEGQGMIEYALLASLIAIISIVVLGFLGLDVRDVFTTIETQIDGAAGG